MKCNSVPKEDDTKDCCLLLLRRYIGFENIPRICSESNVHGSNDIGMISAGRGSDEES